MKRIFALLTGTVTEASYAEMWRKQTTKRTMIPANDKGNEEG